MCVLIELFDANTPIFNVLTATVLRPERIVMLGDAKAQRRKYKDPMMNYLQSAGLTEQVQFEKCNLFELDAIVDCLERLISEYGEHACIIDVTGGSETLLLAVGKNCLNRNIRIIVNRPGSNRMKWLNGPDAGSDMTYDIQISAEQFIMLAGGELLQPAGMGIEDMVYEAHETVFRVFRVFEENRKLWPPFVQYLQLANKPENYRGDSLVAPAKIWSNSHQLCADVRIFSELTKVGVIEDFGCSNRECAFRFASPEIGHWLCDVGIWLELYLYVVMRRSELFDSLKIRAIVSWDDDDDSDDVMNEIDVMATAGIGQLFISCKTGIPDQYMINEIAVLAHRFGTRYATPVLATMCDVRHEIPSLVRRATEMGVEILDGNDLTEDALKARLATIKQRWDRA